jgi:hypothetical protein
MVRLMLALEGDRRIDVHACNERAFRSACIESRVEVIRLLLALEDDRKIDVNARQAFQ